MVPDQAAADLASLQARVRRLAEDKSNLQLVLQLIERLRPLPDVAEMLRNLLASIVEVIGGTRIGIHYWVGDELHYCDFAGQDRVVAAIDDPLVREVATRRVFLEQPGSAADALLRDGVVPGAWTWAFPLLVGQELVGVIKLENLHISGSSLRNFLPAFFSHAALLLSNEIRNQERRRAEEGQRLAASVFAHAHEGICVTDAEERIVDVNPRFCELTGYSAEEVLGRTPRLLKSGYQSAEFYKAMWQAISRDGHWRGEVWNRRRDGRLYAERLTISAVTDGHGVVSHYVGVLSDITSAKEYEERLERIAHYDVLTGIPNRSLLADRMSLAIAQTQRSRTLLGVCYLDLDGFKPINDQFGHEGGDRLLVEVARRLQAISRAEDTVARLGGDEFVLLWNDIGAQAECFQALDRILAEVSAPMVLDGMPVSVSASLGVTLFPDDHGDADSLLRHADHAMYSAKQLGKNRYQIFDAALERQIGERIDFLARVARALDLGQFELHYQPKVDCIAHRVIGVEALIRWQDPERGLMPPKDFLPFLENDPMALRLGRWVMEAAVRQARLWQDMGIGLPISINVFPRHIKHPGFVDDLRAAVGQWPGMPAHRLLMEIVETSDLEDLESIEQVIRECLAMGIGFSLDDFGTGYSSLVYLRRLSVEELKVDQSFVRNMLEDPDDQAIVAGVVGLGKAFGLRVVAEGVESDRQASHLVAMGCPVIQGYGIGRPMPAAALPDWLIRYSGAADHVTP